jgi:hypothetical protein
MDQEEIATTIEYLGENEKEVDRRLLKALEILFTMPQYE